MISWIHFDGGEWWSDGDRFSVRPCIDELHRWYAWDTATGESSPTFEDITEAQDWCEQVLSAEASTVVAEAP